MLWGASFYRREVARGANRVVIARRTLDCVLQRTGNKVAFVEQPVAVSPASMLELFTAASLVEASAGLAFRVHCGQRVGRNEFVKWVTCLASFAVVTTVANSVRDRIATESSSALLISVIVGVLPLGVVGFGTMRRDR